MRTVLLLAMLAIVGCETGTTPVDTAPWVTNLPPTAPTVTITPAQPGVASTLKAEVVEPGTDPEGARVRYRYVWSRTGVVEQDGEDNELNPAPTAEGEEWSVDVFTSDGLQESAPATASATIHELSPTPLTIRLEPDEPAGKQDVSLRVVTQSTDGNDDPLRETILWYANGVRRGAWDGATLIPGAYIDGGDTLRVEVTVTDGHSEPAVAEATAIVPDQPPTLTKVQIDSDLNERFPVTCISDATDEDSNHFGVRYAWYLHGVLVPEAGTGDTLSADLTEVGDQWQCEVSITSAGITVGPLRSNALVIRETWGHHSRRVVALTVATDGTTGERTATGRVELDEGRYRGEPATACDLYWNLVATDDPSVCADCTYSFSVAYTYDAAASTEGPYCAGHPAGDSGGTMSIRAETAAFTAVLDDVWYGMPELWYGYRDDWRTPLPIRATGTGATPGYVEGEAWSVTEGTDPDGNVTISAYTLAYYYY